MKLSRIAWLNIRRNRRRSFLSALAMLVVSAALVFAFSLLEGMKAEMARNVKDWTWGEIKIQHAQFEKNRLLNPLHLNVADADALVSRLAALPETEAATPRTAFSVIIQKDERRFQAQGIGVDLARETAYSRLPSFISAGRLPEAGTREAAVGIGLARKLGLGVGDKFTFMTMTRNRSMYGATLRISGLMDFPVASLNSLAFVLPIDRARSFLQLDGAALEIVAKVKPGLDPADVAEAWNAELVPLGLSAVSWTRSSVVYYVVSYIGVIFNILAAMFILLGSTVVINTTMMVVFERRAEIGMLGALGMRADELVRLFLLEAVFISSLGATAGALIGCGISAFFARGGLDLTAFMGGINVEFPTLLFPALRAGTVLGSLAMTVVISGLASLLPSWSAARIEPVDALRG